MKCPKCSYIGFENTDRCRNCGYDFALATSAAPDADLPLRGDASGPFGDFDLGEGAPRSSADAGSRRRHDADFDPRITPPSRGPAPDLPLFGGETGDDLPIVPAAPPTPIAVRRSAPPPARSRPRPTPRAVVPAAEATLPLAESVTGGDDGGVAREAVAADTSTPDVRDRILAAVVDWVILLGLDAIVIYFTLKICRLAPADVFLLPVGPLSAFLVLLNAGYLAMLTAVGGQTLGKMAFDLRVVGVRERLSVGRAILRTVALLAAALPAGLGLLPAILGPEKRGLHDRLADTRVVRVHAS